MSIRILHGHTQYLRASLAHKQALGVMITALLYTTLQPVSALAANDVITLRGSARTGQTVTLYQQNFALITSRYKLPALTGEKQLRIVDISPGIDPSSIVTEQFGAIANLGVNQPDYSFNTLLKANIGKPIMLQRQIANGEGDKRRKGTLIAVENNAIVISENNQLERIRFDGPWRIRLPQPKTLDNQRYLYLNTRMTKTQSHEAQLSYLANGFSWMPSYDLKLNEQSQKLSLNGHAVISNNTQKTLTASQLRLLAGDVNRSQARPVLKTRMQTMSVSLAANNESMRETSTSGYHLYTLPGTYTLQAGSEMQIPFLTQSNIAFTSQYQQIQTVSAYADPTPRTLHPQHRISFVLPTADKGGAPLPAGEARVYNRDNKGLPIYVGGQSLSATAAGQPVDLNVGEAFDITLKQQQTGFETSDDYTQVSYRIEISNAEKKARSLNYTARFNREWKLLSSSVDGKRIDNQQRWTLNLPAGSKQTLEFKVRLENPEQNRR